MTAAGARVSAITRAVAAAAGVLAVIVAVACDSLAGEHPLHTATLAAALSVLAVVRVRLAGRFRAAFAATTAAALAQPVLHAAVAVVPAHDPHGLTAASVAVNQAVVAVLVVAAVADCEHLLLITLGVRSARLVAPPPGPSPRATCRPNPPPPRFARRDLVAMAPRRGPPTGHRAV